MFQLPSTFAGDVASSTTSALKELSPVITLLVATLLAVTVVIALIQAFRH